MVLKFIGDNSGYFGGFANADYVGDPSPETEARLATGWWVEEKVEPAKPKEEKKKVEPKIELVQPSKEQVKEN